ncbi:helix-turn-helix domain-containing protein [Streptomyces sp. AN091965]|uniref:helix-turn-helix domain-containing protein n=1 Tax=Streptomyces sp. AN091965 TaxID=2927803 RepID=UPI002416124B|nr:helix-turn-helix domain-containing protein [Streptomyces sp. AN091965]
MHVEPIAPAPEQVQEQTSPLRPKTIAAALRVSDHTVYAEIKSGRLASYRVGQGRGTIRVSRAAFERYLADRGIPAADLAVAL